jgi:hypothetical protein
MHISMGLYHSHTEGILTSHPVHGQVALFFQVGPYSPTDAKLEWNLYFVSFVFGVDKHMSCLLDNTQCYLNEHVRLQIPTLSYATIRPSSWRPTYMLLLQIGVCLECLSQVVHKWLRLVKNYSHLIQ